MCRALRVLCAASGADRLAALKRASVSAQWELVGGAHSVEELAGHVAEFAPDVVVVDEGLGPSAVACVREARRAARVVGWGSLEGVDVAVRGLEGIREGILGLPRPGGPVAS